MDRSSKKNCFKVREKITTCIGRTYTIDSIFQREENPSTPPASNTTYSRLDRIKPDVYTAIDNRRRKRRVMVKAIHQENGIQTLQNEANILHRLNWSPIHIAPKCISRIRQKGEIFFFVYEEFDRDRWESLESIVNRKKITINTSLEIHKFRRALENSIYCLHFLGVVHGDIKDEHILVRIKDDNPSTSEDYDFGDIRLIDFGFGTVKRIGIWHGASIGFSSPFFWNRSQHGVFSYKELLGQDWYGVNAVLYYAITGECFPTTSPSYSVLSSPREHPKEREFYNELRQSLIFHHGKNEIDLGNIIQDLAKPDKIRKLPWHISLLKRLCKQLIVHRFWLIYFFLLVGLLGTFLPIWTVFLALGVAILFCGGVSLRIKNMPEIEQEEYLSKEPRKGVLLTGLLISLIAFGFSTKAIFIDHILFSIGSSLALICLSIGLIISHFIDHRFDIQVLSFSVIVGSLLDPFFAIFIPVLCGWFVRLPRKLCWISIISLMINIGLNQYIIFAQLMTPNTFENTAQIWNRNPLSITIIWGILFIVAVLSTNHSKLNVRLGTIVLCGFLTALLPNLLNWVFTGQLMIEISEIIRIIFTSIFVWILGIIVVQEKRKERL